MSSSQPGAAYRKTNMTTTFGLRLVEEAYRLRLGHLQAAADAVGRGDLMTKGLRLGRALDNMMALRGVLDLEAGGEVAAELDRLYGYFIDRVITANIGNRRAPLDEVHWAELLEAWEQAAKSGVPR